MKTSPTPLLVHCASGSDRTGLELSRGAPIAVANDELSAKYGHFPTLESDSAAMGRSWTKYADSGQTKTPSALSP
jgi:protein tyrosine/serine phosphatase